MKLIKALMFANGTDCPHEGQYLLSADFDTKDGMGFMGFTSDSAQALKFATTGEALLYWRTQSKTVPLRADGRPNRPLTALTVEIVDAP